MSVSPLIAALEKATMEQEDEEEKEQQAKEEANDPDFVSEHSLATCSQRVNAAKLEIAKEIEPYKVHRTNFSEAMSMLEDNKNKCGEPPLKARMVALGQAFLMVHDFQNNTDEHTTIPNSAQLLEALGQMLIIPPKIQRQEDIITKYAAIAARQMERRREEEEEKEEQKREKKRQAKVARDKKALEDLMSPVKPSTSRKR